MASIDAAELARLPNWHHSAERGGLLRRSFRFPDFEHAFAFMTEVARHAEQHDHHPEWFNVYHRVDVVLTTHDAGGLTPKDIALAHCMDAAAVRHGALTGFAP